MRLFLISFFILLGLLLGAIYVITIPQIKSEIKETIKKSGFKDVTFNGFKFSPTGFSLKKISAENLEINNFSATLYWPTYFFDKKIDSFLIEILILNANYNGQDKTLLPRLSKKIDTINLSEIPPFKIKELNILINPKILITGQLAKTEHEILTELNANNDIVTFQSKWKLSKNSEQNVTNIHASIENLNIKNKHFGLNRANGWLAYEGGETYTLNAQLEAGSGTLFNAPLNDINIMIGNDDKGQSLLFRSNASGYPEITLNTDIEWSKTFNINLLTMQFLFPSTKILAEYLSTHNIIKENALDKINLNASEITVHYLPERRFADGPYPLEIKTIENKKEKLSGTILVYPDNYDVRGTLTGQETIILLLDDILPLNHLKISNDTLRLEGNLTD